MKIVIFGNHLFFVLCSTIYIDSNRFQTTLYIHVLYFRIYGTYAFLFYLKVPWKTVGPIFEKN